MILRKLASIYRKTFPEPFRRAVRSLLTPFGGNAYNKDFFSYIDSLQADSFPIMASTIARQFKPEKVIDVGCGSGGLLYSLVKNFDISGFGLEYSKQGRDLCVQKGLQVRFADLTQPLQLDETYDLLICLEVAEHLPGEKANQLVSSLTSGPSQVLFSAAVPGQGGNGHINEQPYTYWIEKFSKHSFIIDQNKTDEIRAEWQSLGVARWFANNSMVFIKRDLS